MTVEIRSAHPSEYDAIGALQIAVNRATYGARAQPWETFVADVAARAQECELLVALEDGELAGVVGYVPDETFRLGEGVRPGEASVRMLVVDPARARRGIGSALSRACIERARAAGKERVMLHSAIDQSPARSLYEQLGFTLDPARDRPASDGGTLVCYVLDLTR